MQKRLDSSWQNSNSRIESNNITNMTASGKKIRNITTTVGDPQT